MNRREFITLSGGAVAATLLTGEPLEAGSAASREPLRERLAADPQRPQYHLLPPANWMNDPNGPIFWNGQYHMFYQYNPNGAFWGTMHWGHAVSSDMVHWKHLPIALAPTPGGPDKDGCFSGCAVSNRGVPTLLYTGVEPEVQCLATSDDEMVTWRKYAGNPIISGPPQGLEVTGFRDPCVWSEGETWYMALGSGFKGVGGAALLYKSTDLVHWEYLHPLCVGKRDERSQGDNPVASGEMWECPDFFLLGDKHVLLVSTQSVVRYLVGTYADQRFHPETEGIVDLGDYYAAKSMVDGSGRRILWGWVREARSDAAQRAAGWSGVMSLPRVLSLGGGGELNMIPPPELQVLRGRRHGFANLPIEPESASLLRGVRGDSLEIAAEFDPTDAAEFGLKVRAARDGSEQTLIAYNRAVGRLRVDRERSSLNPEVSHKAQDARLELTPGERLELRIFLDGSVLEIFANGRACLTSRVYPSRADSLGIGLWSRGGRAKLRAMEVWEMRAISGDRLTT